LRIAHVPSGPGREAGLTVTPIFSHSVVQAEVGNQQDVLSMPVNVIKLDEARRDRLGRKKEVFEILISSFVKRRRNLKKLDPKTLAADEWVARLVLAVTGRFPWEMDEDAARTFVEYLRNHPGITRNDTRRGMLSRAQRFIEYIMSVRALRRLIRREFGVEMSQPFRGRLMLSFHEKDDGDRRQAVTHEHFAVLFNTLKMLIRGAAHWREGLPLVRDLVMLYIAYVLGLRASELLGLDADSFMDNPLDLDLGEYGRVVIKNGKGSNGSGPKTHIIPVLHPDVPALLRLYIDHIRDFFVSPDNPEEKGLFLSLDGGQKMTVCNLDHRFVLFLEEAGLSEIGYVVHSLRHSCISHLRMSVPGDTVREVARQSDIFVTDGYSHLRREHLQAVCGGFILDEVAEATGDSQFCA